MFKKKMLALVLIGGWLISTVFAGGCIPAGDGGEEGGSPWTMIIFIVLIFAAMYFLMIRPQRKKQKEHQEMMIELKKGDRVITAGGIYGTIESLSDDSVIVKVESGATMRVSRGSISIMQDRMQTRSSTRYMKSG